MKQNHVVTAGSASLSTGNFSRANPTVNHSTVSRVPAIGSRRWRRRQRTVSLTNGPATTFRATAPIDHLDSFSGIFGIIALAMSLDIENIQARGDFAAAQRSSNTPQTLCIIGNIASVLGYGVTIISIATFQTYSTY